MPRYRTKYKVSSTGSKFIEPLELWLKTQTINALETDIESIIFFHSYLMLAHNP